MCLRLNCLAFHNYKYSLGLVLFSVEMRLQIVNVEHVESAESVEVKSSNFRTTVTYPKESIQQNLDHGQL